jgi:hypothetical protein
MDQPVSEISEVGCNQPVFLLGVGNASEPCGSVTSRSVTQNVTNTDPVLFLAPGVATTPDFV